MSDKGHEREKLEVVIFGCGAMAVETAMYLSDINLQNNVFSEELKVTDVVSSNFTRLEDIQTILGYEVNTYKDINEVASFSSKRSIIAIGANSPVLKIRNDILDVGGLFISIIHPSSCISPTSKIGDGVIVLSEILLKIHQSKLKILEIHSIFINRVRGESSVNFKLIIQSFFGLIKLFLIKIKKN